jgi:hypothetical protein
MPTVPFSTVDHPSRDALSGAAATHYNKAEVAGTKRALFKRPEDHRLINVLSATGSASAGRA